MELDEMKQAWQSLASRLDHQETLALREYQARHVDRVRGYLRPLIIGQIFQLLCGLGMSFVFGSFWIDHLGSMTLLVSGVLLHAYGVAYILAAARELYILGSIDYSAPVLAIQKRFAHLRAWRLRSGLYIGLAGCVLWVPFIVVCFQMLFGVDLMEVAPLFVWILVASGVASALVLYLFARWLRYPQRAALATRLYNSALGWTLRRAQQALDEVGRFEHS